MKLDKKIKKDEHLITKLQNIHGKYVFSSFYKCDSFEFFISRVYKIHIEKSNFLLCFVMQNWNWIGNICTKLQLSFSVDATDNAGRAAIVSSRVHSRPCSRAVLGDSFRVALPVANWTWAPVFLKLSTQLQVLCVLTAWLQLLLLLQHRLRLELSPVCLQR